jgi:hypothetical protein
MKCRLKYFIIRFFHAFQKLSPKYNNLSVKIVGTHVQAARWIAANWILTWRSCCWCRRRRGSCGR